MRCLPSPNSVNLVRNLYARALKLLPAVVMAALPVMVTLVALNFGHERLANRAAQRAEAYGSESADKRLIATVRPLAQALGELAGTAPEAERERLLIRALTPVRYGEGPWDYVFLSKGTVNIMTPGVTGASGVDFANATDARGVTFVREMQSHAVLGGGFTQWVALLPDGTTETRRVYSLVIPGTDYWLGAWTTPQHLAAEQHNAATAAINDADHAARYAVLWGVLGSVPVALLLHRGIFSARRKKDAAPPA